jgi:hypothetical protein
MGENTQDYILGYFQSSLRDWFLFSNPTQHCVLGYSQPSLRDSTPNRQVLTRTLKPGPTFQRISRGAPLSFLPCR